MEFTSVASNVAYILQSHCGFPVFTEYPSSSADRNSFYGVVGINSAKIEIFPTSEIQKKDALLDIKLNVSLFAPPDTDYSVLYRTFEEKFLNILTISNLNISDMQVSAVIYNKNLNQLELSSCIVINGISEVE